jgi:hypothetical protein
MEPELSIAESPFELSKQREPTGTWHLRMFAIAGKADLPIEAS